ncbi:magnesium chelatase domain-containing protein [Spongiactinospora sp. TRM90649]|uniref:magnesium chelatase domain-containing protein n=1 Tax=Spongiactinospora sp. TRM90649 TaxID=3031114 RepID=UPI0023F94CC8|nr:magnesium chelatase domain-containing protein [Spongiactinospora sp. TRM90649]MDF5759017.1 magnesium chelatase domain-containing protein [Spongiactinospora sp. TRM90649]
MAYASMRSAVRIGTVGRLVDNDADTMPGTPRLRRRGIPAPSAWPVRDRLRAAALNSGMNWPDEQAMMNVRSAGAPVYSSSADLALALVILAATGTVSPDLLSGIITLANKVYQRAEGPLRTPCRRQEQAGVVPVSIVWRRQPAIIGGAFIISVSGARSTARPGQGCNYLAR